VRKRESQKYQLAQSSKFMHGAARADAAAAGGKGGKPMASRIFLMVACVLKIAIRRKSPLQFAHLSWTLKVRRRSSLQEWRRSRRLSLKLRAHAHCKRRSKAVRSHVEGFRRLEKRAAHQ
jgi:hypothetical protein